MAPGTILQQLYIRERLKKNGYRNFIEIGSGQGALSNLLLKSGLSGVGFDLNCDACKINSDLNRLFIQKNQYEVLNEDFLRNTKDISADLIISCMVIEHLSESERILFFEKAKTFLNEKGRIVILVPASMNYWGIEDEIAGHYLRFERADFKKLADANGLQIDHIAGLTYPLSNILFPMSNYLVRRAEGNKKGLSMQQQTIESGNRQVMFKTQFPFFMKLFLNDIVLFPLHLLQKAFSKHSKAMVLYCELSVKK